MGSLAWLRARSSGEYVAKSWVYRISRHPQYLGWIIWTYGLYVLILSGQYPRRSWGISASLPWLLSTLVIIGVAMIEELNMRRQHGDEYESYRRTAPFLFPLPHFVERAFASPFRILFVLRDPNRWAGDLRRLMRREEVPNPGLTWNNVGRWALGILRGFPPFAEIDKHSLYLDWALPRVAAINLKKRSGVGAVPSEVINAYARQDVDLLREQIRSISPAPDFVVACGTWDPLLWVLEFSVPCPDEPGV